MRFLAPVFLLLMFVAAPAQAAVTRDGDRLLAIERSLKRAAQAHAAQAHKNQRQWKRNFKRCRETYWAALRSPAHPDPTVMSGRSVAVFLYVLDLQDTVSEPLNPFFRQLAKRMSRLRLDDDLARQWLKDRRELLLWQANHPRTPACRTLRKWQQSNFATAETPAELYTFKETLSSISAKINDGPDSEKLILRMRQLGLSTQQAENISGLPWGDNPIANDISSIQPSTIFAPIPKQPSS